MLNRKYQTENATRDKKNHEKLKICKLKKTVGKIK